MMNKDLAQELGIPREHNPRRAGWFFILLTLVLAAGIAVVEGDILSGVAEVNYRIHMDRGYRLKVGSPVLLSDIIIGDVSEITLSPGGDTVTAVIRVFPAYAASLPSPVKAGIGQENLISPAIILSRDDSGAATVPGIIAFVPGRDLQSEAEQLIATMKQELGSAVENIRVFTEVLNDSTGDVRRFGREMAAGAATFRQATLVLHTGVSDPTRGAAGVLLNDPRTATAAARIVTRVDSVSASMAQVSDSAVRITAGVDSAVVKTNDLLDRLGQNRFLFGAPAGPVRRGSF
jgi:ABC-type transporter Mla subunit MlaD